MISEYACILSTECALHIKAGGIMKISVLITFSAYILCLIPLYSVL